MLPSSPSFCAWLLPAAALLRANGWWPKPFLAFATQEPWSGPRKWRCDPATPLQSDLDTSKKGGIWENRASISHYLPMRCNMHGQCGFSYIFSQHAYYPYVLFFINVYSGAIRNIHLKKCYNEQYSIGCPSHRAIKSSSFCKLYVLFYSPSSSWSSLNAGR